MYTRVKQHPEYTHACLSRVNQLIRMLRCTVSDEDKPYYVTIVQRIHFKRWHSIHVQTLTHSVQVEPKEFQDKSCREEKELTRLANFIPSKTTYSGVFCFESTFNAVEVV